MTANKTWVYTYDRRGNILSRKTYAYTTGTLGTVQDTDTYEYYDQSSSTMWGDALLRYDGTNFISYDAIGNPTYYVNGPDQGYAYVFSWQNGRQLASGTKGATEFAYTYNADGLRTKKVVDGVTTEYYWAGSQLAMMVVTTASGAKKTLKFYYDAEGRPLCLDFNGTVYLYITNLQGDVVALADQYGEVIRYEYDAWGKPISTYYVASPYYDAMQYNPLRYRGYIYDNETGFYYLQSRYYDPVVGRFINADGYVSTGQGFSGYNMYAYCGNNPVNRADSKGENWRTVFAIGAVIAVVGLAALAAVPTGGTSLVLAGTGITVASTTIVTAANITVATGVALMSASMVTGMSEEISTNHTNTQIKSHSVYFLEDSQGNVQYVGRTVNVKARKAAHKASKNRGHLEMNVVAKNLTYAEARALEEAGMLYYHTINTADKMNNQINGISPSFWGTYKEFAKGTLEYAENQMTNEILCWLGI